MNEIPVHPLLAIDIVVVVLYFAILIAVGFGFRRFASQSIENFFLAGRKLPGWVNGISYAATSINTDVAPAYCAWTVSTGLFVCWLYFSRFGLALMIGAVLFAVFWRRLKIFTAPEFYELRYGGNIGSVVRTWVAIRSAFIAIVAWTGAGLIGIHKVVGPILGWSKLETMAAFLPVLLLYVLMSGYMGVVSTDVIQSVIIVLGSLVLCFAVLMDFGGPAGLLNRLVEQLGDQVVSNVPPLEHHELGAVAVIAWLIGTSVGYGGDASPMAGAMEGQRILSCRDDREASKMYIATEIALFLMLAFITLPALGALAKDPSLYAAPREVRENVFANLLATYLPPGLLGLQIAALLAAVMSTASSNLNFGAQVVVSDIYRRHINPSASDRHLIWVGRLVMLFILALSLVIVWKGESLITIAIFMLGLSSAEYAANWAQWWWWRFNRWGRLAASFGGPILFVLVKFVFFPTWNEYEHVLMSVVCTTVLWVSVTLSTKPEPEEKLRTFYIAARPLGFWRPVQEKLSPPEGRPHSFILKGLGLASLGLFWIASAILGLSDLYVGRFDLGVTLLIVSVVLATLFFFVYRRFMKAIGT